MQNAVKTYPGNILTQIENFRRNLAERGEENKFDPRRFVEAYCKIEDRSGNVVNLIHNKVQMQFHDAWCQAEEERGIFWALNGKSRQHGLSTLIDVRLAVDCYSTPNILALIIAHEWVATDRLFAKSTFAYKSLPSDLRELRTLTSPQPSQRSMTFSFPHNSQLICHTAGKKLDFGHSLTIHKVHLSEMARYNDANTLMTGIANANHYVSGSVRIVETTGEGHDPWFYPHAMQAMKGKGPYQWFFFGVKDYDDAYYEDIPPEYEEIDDIRPDEQEYIDKHELSPKQTKFFIFKKRDGCGDQWPIYKNQFPATAEEMFEQTGSQYFDLEALNWLEEHCACEPIAKGDLIFDNLEIGSTINLDENARHPLVWIYKRPDPDKDYLLCMDCAEGVRGDYTVIKVFEILLPTMFGKVKGLITKTPTAGYKLEEVAHYATNRVAIDLSSVHAFMLGHYYNQAYACIENNNHGLLVLKYFENGHNLRDFPQAFVPYPAIYYPVTQSTKDEEEVNRLGWQTGRTTKPILINTCAQWIREKRYIIHSQRTIDELMGFYWDPETKQYRAQNRRPEDQRGHDDEVITTALAPQALEAWVSRPRLMERIKQWRW